MLYYVCVDFFEGISIDPMRNLHDTYVEKEQQTCSFELPILMLVLLQGCETVLKESCLYKLQLDV